MSYVYIKSNRRKYKGSSGPNGYYSFEYGYINPDGGLKPVGTDADAITFYIPVRCDYIDKDTMRIWSDGRKIKWRWEGSDNADLIEEEK